MEILTPITQTDLGNLADILWWIKGYHAGAREAAEDCPFNMDHVESLIKVRVQLIAELRDRKAGEETLPLLQESCLTCCYYAATKKLCCYDLAGKKAIANPAHWMCNGLHWSPK